MTILMLPSPPKSPFQKTFHEALVPVGNPYNWDSPVPFLQVLEDRCGPVVPFPRLFAGCGSNAFGRLARVDSYRVETLFGSRETGHEINGQCMEHIEVIL